MFQVESDSGGALRDTFDAEDVSDGVKDVLLSTIYFRCRWRTPPTLLNGTTTFRDNSNRTTPMFRVNDVINYADLTEWDAEVRIRFFNSFCFYRAGTTF